MKRLAALCSMTPADCSKNTNGAALPSMIGTSGSTQVNVGIVDAKAGQRRHEMFDRFDGGVVVSQGRAEHGFADMAGICDHVDRRIEIQAPEHDTRVLGCRPQRHIDLVTGMQPDSRRPYRVFQRSLSDHGLIEIQVNVARRFAQTGHAKSRDFPPCLLVTH